MGDCKKKKSLHLTERQIRDLGARGRTLGLGISEYLRRVLDDPGVIAAMDRMTPGAARAKESPEDFLRDLARR